MEGVGFLGRGARLGIGRAECTSNEVNTGFYAVCQDERFCTQAKSLCP